MVPAARRPIHVTTCPIRVQMTWNPASRGRFGRHAAAIVDGVYDEIYRMLRPGVREHEVVITIEEGSRCPQE